VFLILNHSVQKLLTACVCDLISRWGPYIEDVPPQKCVEAFRLSISTSTFHGQTRKMTTEEMVDLWNFRVTIPKPIEVEDDDEGVQEDDDTSDDGQESTRKRGRKRKKPASKGEMFIPVGHTPY
jgi:hypothetical protein